MKFKPCITNGIFDPELAIDQVIQWIRLFYEENGKGCNAVVGVSGGKDSTVVADLCTKALGKDRVIGVLMPNGEQKDIEDSLDVVHTLGIKNYTINISGAYQFLLGELVTALGKGENHDIVYPGFVSDQTKINLPARLRMATLYAVSQSNNGRVVNTCNLSEDWVGYATRYGDGAGDFSPLAQFTVSEVVAIGYQLGIPNHLIEKVPSDGLCGRTDEDNLGFTYAVLDKYIRTGICEDPEIKEKIDSMHKKNVFKMKPMPFFDSGLDILAA